MKREIVEYCRSDLDILRRGCLEFQQLFLETTGIDPFASCITIASACNLIYRKSFLKPEIIAILPQNRRIDKQSMLACKWMSYLAETNQIQIQHARNGREYHVGTYRVDRYAPSVNTIFEFHGMTKKKYDIFCYYFYSHIIIKTFFFLTAGCVWHGCPKCYARTTINPVNGLSMQTLHERTLERKQFLMNCQYTVIEEWECELNRELKANPDMQAYFDNHFISDPLEPREAFYGGRTNAAKLYHEVNDD